MQKKKVIVITSGLAMLTLLLVASPSLAATPTKASGHGFMGRGAGFLANRVKPAAAGKITAINGSLLTISGTNNTTYTIDAANAKITTGFGPSAQTIAVGNLTVGEMISVTGTVSGTNVAATAISAFNGQAAGSRPAFNGVKLAAAGKISAISGSIVTVTGRNNTTYTVDASSAKITSGFGTSTQTIAISNLTVGETISVTGTVSGNNVTATAISAFTGTRNTGNITRTPRVMGKVTAINGSSFTVQANRGFRGAKKTATTATVPAAVTYIVNTTGSTTFTKDGKAATLADVTTGEMVNVSGTPDASNNVTANSVNVVTKIAAPRNGAHTAPKTSTKTSLIGKFFNLFKGGKK